jgi:hypothetical protein
MGDDVPVRVILRWAMVTGAAIVAAWFGLGWIQARDLGRAQGLVSASRLSPSQVRSAAALLNTAGDLNPDRSVDIARAQLADKQHRPGLAVTISEQVTRDEPFNIDAWRELSFAAAYDHRRALAEQAFRVVLGLIKVHK